MYKNEKDKPSSDKLSAAKVSALVEEQTKIRVPPRSIQQAVKEDRAGLSPLKQGRPGNFPQVTFENSSNAFETYIKIKQINGQGGDVSSSRLTTLIQKCTIKAIQCDCTSLI